MGGSDGRTATKVDPCVMSRLMVDPAVVATAFAMQTAAWLGVCPEQADVSSGRQTRLYTVSPRV